MHQKHSENVDVSHLAKFKWCVWVCVRECDLGWLWEKWLLTQNSYRFDMVRWWWHNFVPLFLGIFFSFLFVFSPIHFCALILTIVAHSTLPCLSVFYPYFYTAQLSLCPFDGQAFQVIFLLAWTLNDFHTSLFTRSYNTCIRI